MLTDIKPYFSPSNFCIENVFVSMCKELKVNYKRMYAYAWNFGYLDTEERFFNRIVPDRNRQLINFEEGVALESFCGFNPVWHFNQSFDNFVSIVKKELSEGRPVGLGIDIYSCYWHIFYNKFHFVHYCLITGIDETGFICVDDTLASTNDQCALEDRPEYVRIDFETCQKYHDGFITFEKTPIRQDISKDRIIYKAAVKTLTGYRRISDFDQMRSLLSDFEKNFDIEKELGEAKDPKAVEIIRTFAVISWSRSNYSKFLLDKSEDCVLDVDYIASKITESAQIWEGMSNYILRIAMTSRSNFNKETLCECLASIIDIEEALAKYIVHNYEMKVLNI